jgi:hypothetical protein
MMRLDELADRERWCGEKMADIRALNPYAVMPGERTSVYDAVIATWQEIHAAYRQIASIQSDEAGEALKRALFLQWYEVAEPFFLTGILNLDEGSKTAMLIQAESFLEDDGDLELREMVAWYAGIADYAFDAASTGPRFRQWCTTGANLAWLTSDAQRQTYAARGLMGEYFASLTTPTKR